MSKETREEFPLWPENFTKRRKFDRQAENKPYLEFLLHPPIFDEEDEEEEEEQDEDENAEAYSGHCKVRTFMKGQVGEEDALLYRDQVEEVASFCENAQLAELETKTGRDRKHVALLDDRNARSTILTNKGSSPQGNCRPYLGPLTAQDLSKELSRKRFRIASEQNVPMNAFEDEEIDAERRVIFVTDLDPATIEALITTASHSQASALRDLIYYHLMRKSAIGVTIPSLGFAVFTLNFHIPYYVLRVGKQLRKDSRKKHDGKPLRQSWELPFLSTRMSTSKSTEGLHCLYEAQISVVVTGIDDWVWTGYGFIDVYFDSKETVGCYDQMKEQDSGLADPLAAGRINPGNPIWMPREYFFKVLEIRMYQVLREWNWIVDKVDEKVKQQQVRDFTLWNTQMVRLLRQLIRCLSDTLEAWGQFQQKEIGYFRCHNDPPTTSRSFISSVAAVETTFGKLKALRGILHNLKKELCEENSQGLNAHLRFENHEAAIFQHRTAGNIKALTVVTIVFSPLGLSSVLFSTTGVLPFARNPMSFTFVLLVLAVLIMATLLVSFNWRSWLQTAIIRYHNASRTSPIFPKRSSFPFKLRTTGLHEQWDLEIGCERVNIKSPKFDDAPKTPSLPSNSQYISPSNSVYSFNEIGSSPASYGQPSVIRVPTRSPSEHQGEGFIDTSDEPFLNAYDKSSLYVDKIREGFRRLPLSRDPSASTTFRIFYQVSWDLPAYLYELFHPKQKLSDVLTLTAGVSDEFSNGFATSVGDYVERTWKSTGILLLQVIETWLSNKRRGETVQRNSDVEIRIKNGAGIGIDHYNKSEKATNVRIEIKARVKDHVDLATALSWLCASLRFSPHRALSSSGVNISRIPVSDDKRIEIRIRPTDLVLSDGVKGCWNILFAQSVIAKGFQIPKREEGKGLEISFPNMEKLAGILRLVEYDRGLVGEGLNTLLVPIKLLEKDQAMQWHIEEKLALSQVGDACQYRSVTNILSSHDSWYRELLPEALASKRAFLGWTPRPKVTTGIIDRPSDLRDPRASLARKGDLCITSYNVATGSSGLAFGGLELGVAAAPARGQKYSTRNHLTILRSKLRHAAETKVVLYDAGAKIAWQVTQLSLMVYMIHAAIHQRDVKVDSSQGSIKYTDCKESHKIGLDDSHAALGTISLGHDLRNAMLERLCLTFERVIELLAEQRSNPDRVCKKPPEWLLGIELNDVILEKNMWRVRESRVRQPWTHLADNTCPIFFCQNLEQAVAPTDLGGLCKALQRVACIDVSKRRSLTLPLRRAVTNFAARFKRKQKEDSFPAVELDLDYQCQDDQMSRQVNSSGQRLYVPPRQEPTSLAGPYYRKQRLKKDSHLLVDLDRQPRNKPQSHSIDETRSTVIIARQRYSNSTVPKPVPSGHMEENLQQNLERCCARPPAPDDRSAADKIDEWDDSDEPSNCTPKSHVVSGTKTYFPPSSTRTTAEEGASQAHERPKSSVRASATTAIELAPENLLEEHDGQSSVFLSGNPIEQSAIVDNGEDEIGGKLNTASRLSALREIELVNDGVVKESGDSMASLAALAIEQITVEDKVDSKINGTTAVAENDVLEPTSSATESGAKYSEEAEADFMKLLSGVPIIIQDSEGESQAVNAVIDTGASSSFISREVTHQYGLHEMPLQVHDIKSFEAINHEGINPTTYVVVQVKCSKIGLNKSVQTFFRVLDIDKVDIILGRPFIQQHGILDKILSKPRFGIMRDALLIIQEKHPNDAKSFFEYEETDSNPTAAGQYDLSVRPPSNSKTDPIAVADTTVSALSFDLSESEASSTEDDTDSDEDSITEIDAQHGRIGIPPVRLGGYEDLTGILRPLRRALVERLMTEVWELLNQDCVEYTRKCQDTSESTTTAQFRSKDKPSTQDSTKAKNKKRTWDNEDNENPDEDDEGPSKRPKKLSDPTGNLYLRNNFACPYRKYDPRKYCAHSQNRKWRSCAVTPLANVSRVKSHLYRHHIIYQCSLCRETFRDEEELTEHNHTAKDCKRRLSDEAEGVQGVNANIERRLRSRKKSNSTQSQEDRWKDIFQVLFGDRDVPTPYFEPVEEASLISAVSSPNSQLLADCEEYSKRELLKLIESKLKRAAQSGMRDIEEDLRRLLPDMIRDCFSGFRSMLASNIDSLPADAHQGTISTDLEAFRPSPLMEPINFALEYLPTGTQSDNLVQSYVQPPHQIRVDPLSEMSPISISIENGQRNAFLDSDYLTNSTLAASSPATSQDKEGTERGNKNKVRALQSSWDPIIRNLNPSWVADVTPRTANNDSMSMREGEVGAPWSPTELLVMTGQQMFQANLTQTDSETWDLWNVDLGLDQVFGSGGQ